MKEAEIQKLHANLTANQLSHSLNSRNDNKESSKLNSLETEPVKLGGSPVGEYIILISFNKLWLELFMIAFFLMDY